MNYFLIDTKIKNRKYIHTFPKYKEKFRYKYVVGFIKKYKRCQNEMSTCLLLVRVRKGK